MKQKRNLWTMLAVLGLGIMTGCQPEPLNEDKVIVSESEAWQPTMSINEFKVSYDIKDSLFTVNNIESDVVIRGRVISTDVAGNIYKYFVMQDTNGDALKVSVDAGSLSGTIPMGQEIAIKCNGLALGRYADMVQLGVESFNDEKMRVEPGRVPYPYFSERMQLIGTPDVSKIVVDTITIKELLASDSTIHSKLVCIKNVHFTGLGDEGESLRDAEKIFAPSTFNGTYNVGYPQARQIADASGNVAYISTSEYARFADMAIPAEDVWGDVVAIVGWYDDKADDDSSGEFQLTIRTLDDLHGFFDGTGGTPGGGDDEPEDPENPGTGNGEGSKENPYNVVSAAQNQNNEFAWVKAYIVGQVSDDWDKDMQYDAPFTGGTNDDGSIKTYGTNLLIADDVNANTTAQVMPVQLPSGAVRLAINLVEHPEMDSKEVLLYGKLTKYFSVAGVKEVSCAIIDGEVYGVDPTTIVTPEGGVIFEETFASSQGTFTIKDVTLPAELTYVWTAAADYKCMKASAYKGGALQAESWLISPAIALNGKAATLSFEHASKFAKDNAQEMQLHYSVDGGATWTELTIPTYSPGEYQFVPSGSVELPAADNVQIAFVYKSSSSNACTWEVKNVKVYQ